MADVEYAVQYPDHLVFDKDWRCVADVIATYHGTTYVTDDRRVTGILLSRRRGSKQWTAA